MGARSSELIFTIMFLLRGASDRKHCGVVPAFYSPPVLLFPLAHHTTLSSGSLSLCSSTLLVSLFNHFKAYGNVCMSVCRCTVCVFAAYHKYYYGTMQSLSEHTIASPYVFLCGQLSVWTVRFWKLINEMATFIKKSYLFYRIKDISLYTSLSIVALLCVMEKYIEYLN